MNGSDGSIAPTPGRDLIQAQLADTAIPTGANAGLVYDRFLKVWDTRQEPGTRIGTYKGVLDDLVLAFKDQEKEGAGRLDELHQRTDRALEPERSRRKVFTTTWRLASGLGASHPLENGFTFDRNLGVPYLPGSAIKGLCRAEAELEGLDTDTFTRIFGSPPRSTGRPHRDSEEEHQIGELVFLPAFPAVWPRLEVDIVNCHHSSYYANRHTPGLPQPSSSDSRSSSTGRRPDSRPVDWESPIPVFFLTVAPGTPFVFRLAGRAGRTDLLDETLGLLERGLDLLGIGAKTAVGYGVMEPAADNEIEAE